MPAEDKRSPSSRCYFGLKCIGRQNLSSKEHRCRNSMVINGVRKPVCDEAKRRVQQMGITEFNLMISRENDPAVPAIDNNTQPHNIAGVLATTATSRYNILLSQESAPAVVAAATPSIPAYLAPASATPPATLAAEAPAATSPVKAVKRGASSDQPRCSKNKCYCRESMKATCRLERGANVFR